MSNWPAHEYMYKMQPKAAFLHRFLAFINEEGDTGYEIVGRLASDEYYDCRHWEVSVSDIDELVKKFVGIDSAEIECEKEAMYKECLNQFRSEENE